MRSRKQLEEGIVDLALAATRAWGTKLGLIPGTASNGKRFARELADRLVAAKNPTDVATATVVLLGLCAKVLGHTPGFHGAAQEMDRVLRLDPVRKLAMPTASEMVEEVADGKSVKEVVARRVDENDS